jgi:hypothetical protein
MTYVSKLIADIHIALEENANERQLLNFIEESLCLLRTIYRESRAEFTDEAILFLKLLTSIQDSLRELIETIEEKDWIRTRDDAQELAARFAELKERLTPHLVSKRAEKELREVVAGAEFLPVAAVVASETNFRDLRSQLESRVQPCQKCGSKMLIREGQHGFFWGCSAFPKCFSRRSMSAEESKCLFP